MKRMRSWVFVLLAVLASVPAFAKGDGEEMLEDFVKQKALIDDERLVAYVRAVGNRVAAQARRPDLTFHFNVVDDASVNAFATEDGYIFVHRGLLAYLDREDQLAGVLGHEVAHVVLAHVTQSKRSQFLNSLAGFAAGLLTFNYDIQKVVEAYGAERIRGYGREFELQADQHGAEYMMAAGYDPQAMIEVVQVLKDQELFAKRVNGQNTTYHGLFASHPRNDQRLQQAVATVTSRMTDEAAEPVDDYLTRVEGLTWGNAGAAGAVRGQQYFHGRLGFVLEVPADWKLTESTSKLMAYMPGGALEGFVSMELDTARDGLDAEEMLTQVVKPGEIKDGVAFEIADVPPPDAPATPAGAAAPPASTPPEAAPAGAPPASAGSGTPTPPKADTAKADDEDEDKPAKKMQAYMATVVGPPGTQGLSLVAVVLKDGRAHIFRGETREPKSVEALRAGMKFILEHLRTITYGDLKLANTERIVLYEAQPGDTYESLARGTAIQNNGANELRLLNGDYPNGQPRAGDRIKLVR